MLAHVLPPVKASESAEDTWQSRSLTPTDTVMQSIAKVIEAANKPPMVYRKI